ncbi:MAG TPA: TIGR00341 family protein [Alphaproteobacteria bacterium]|nr:TIGR00341 family protein [Alphaproteobacteria bacterium]
MNYELVEITAAQGSADTIRAIAETAEVELIEITAPADTRPGVWQILAGSDKRQAILDKLQQSLGSTKNWRIVILPTEAILPRPSEEDADTEAQAAKETREELYEDIAKSAEGGGNFYLLAVLSTIVAAIGLLTNNVAVIIGAMVIAPLLGPNIAFAYGTILGDRKLMISATRTNLAGIAISISISIALGAVWPHTGLAGELLARTDVGYDSIALALASGFAAALSMTTGVSTALVGVMVAVALLPPAATFGLMIGARRFDPALGAALLLAVNVICVNLSAQITFIVKGFGPRTWWQKKRAKSWGRLNLLVLTAFLLILAGLIYLRQTQLN